MRKPAEPERVLLTHDRLLCRGLRVDCYCRFAVSITIVLGSLIAKWLIGITGLDLRALFASAVVIVVYNLITLWLIRPYRGTVCDPRAYSFLLGLRHVTIALDYLALTVLVYLVGGARSPLLSVFLLHVVITSILGSRRASVVHALLAYLLLGGLVVSEWAGWIRPELPAGAVCGGAPLDGRYAFALLVVYGVLFVATSLMVTGVARALRIGEHELRQANAELEQVSRSRRDFLHVVLHNLQAPISATSMMLENLQASAHTSLQPDQRRWLERSLERLRASSQFLRDLGILAALENGDLAQQAAPLPLEPVLRAALEDVRDLAESRHHQLELELAGELPTVVGIERLLREAIVNYLTNAIKYTPDGGRIILRARAGAGRIEIEVEDNGVGIASEDQHQLFREFVRIRPGAVGAQAPGTGLGLSITRRIVEAHGGSVGVESEPGRGSVFRIVLPPGRR